MRDNRWYILIGLVAILGIIGIVYWLYRSESRLLRFRRTNNEAVPDEL